jgi:hypothetical protein
MTRPETLKVYALEDGKEPYTEWLENLKDYTSCPDNSTGGASQAGQLWGLEVCW